MAREKAKMYKNKCIGLKIQAEVFLFHRKPFLLRQEFYEKGENREVMLTTVVTLPTKSLLAQ